MEIKLFEAELKVMALLWQQGELPAADIARQMSNETGWNKNTTYTVIKKLIAKHAVERTEPHFICRALITKEKVQHQETENLIQKMYDGSRSVFFASFLKHEKLTQEDITQLKKMIKEME